MSIFDIEEKKKKEPEQPEKGRGIELECEEPTRTVSSGSTTNYEVTLRSLAEKEEPILIKIDLVYSEADRTGMPEWVVQVRELLKETWDITLTRETQKEIILKKGEEKKFTLSVVAPRGPEYGDHLDIVLGASSIIDPALRSTVTITTTVRQSIFAVKTSIGHERSVADSIASRAKSRGSGIFSVLSPATLRGYVLVESINPDRLQDIVKGIRRARGIVTGETTFEEIDHFLTPKPLVSGIVEGDIVELISGPFKGEKARVQQIDESKEEITVELFEAMVPIPVTVKGDNVRVLQKEEREEGR